MSDMTQAETELRRERDKAEEQCAAWREVLRLEREHAAARLTAMTKAHDTLADQVALDTARIITVVQQYTEAQQEIARLRTALEYYAQTAISATAVQALAGTEEVLTHRDGTSHVYLLGPT